MSLGQCRAAYSKAVECSRSGIRLGLAHLALPRVASRCSTTRGRASSLDPILAMNETITAESAFFLVPGL